MRMAYVCCCSHALRCVFDSKIVFSSNSRDNRGDWWRTRISSVYANCVEYVFWWVIGGYVHVILIYTIFCSRTTGYKFCGAYIAVHWGPIFEDKKQYEFMHWIGAFQWSLCQFVSYTYSCPCVWHAFNVSGAAITPTSMLVETLKLGRQIGFEIVNENRRK